MRRPGSIRGLSGRGSTPAPRRGPRPESPFPFALAFALALAPLLAAVPAAADTGEVDFYDNVVIVLDASGSMDGVLPDGKRRMDAAKEALRDVLSGLDPATRVGLLVFSASNLRDDWAYPLGPRDEARLLEAAGLPEPGGGTPLGEYIKKGADALLTARAAQFGYGTYRLLVVTDGEAHDPQLVDRHTADAMSRGITMNAIGVGMKTDHTLARKVHSYRAANDAATLRLAVAEAFAEVTASGAGSVTAADFELLSGLPVEAAGAMVKALAQSGNHPIGTSPDGAAATADAAAGPAGPGAGGGGGGSSSNASSIVVFFILFLVVVNVFEKLAKALRGKK